MLASLTTGQYFGEANIIFNWTRRRTANVISFSISKLAMIEYSQFGILLEAFPDWSDRLATECRRRLAETLNTENEQEMEKKLARSHTKRIRKDQRNSIIHIMLGRYEPVIRIQQNIWADIIHFLLILYTSISISLVIGFHIHFDDWMMSLEIICFTESLLYCITKAYGIIRYQHGVTAAQVLK